MALYKWEGVARNGQIKSGTKEAPTEAAMLQFLRSQQIRPKKLSAVKTGGLGGFNFAFGSGVSQKELVVFSRQFATMIDAGLPLVQCLEILGNQAENPAFKKVIKGVQVDVEGGSTFADSLKKYPDVFDSLYVNLVAAGEVGGILDVILQRLSAYLEKAAKLKGQVKSAMVYPIAIAGVAVLVITVLLVWVIPIFENMFKEFGGAALPAPTQIVINLSKWTQHNFIFLVMFGVGMIFLWKWIRKNPRTLEITDDIFLKLPIFGPLIRKVAVARFTRTLGTMISSGVPILEALDITARAAGNKTVEKAIYRARQSISEGKSVAEPIAQSKVFPPMVCQMINVGEQTGALDTMLGKIADFYDEEVDAAVKGLTSLMEPAMMVILGGIIGGLVVAMYLPIFELAGNLKAG
ncbi:MAG: type II secretion system F family protein [Deltaproteobacteria bacterium]|nr:type II secretion system F family protein [Deltaproteobacteria bacterium]